jgi:hypothetical protein
MVRINRFRTLQIRILEPDGVACIRSIFDSQVLPAKDVRAELEGIYGHEVLPLLVVKK